MPSAFHQQRKLVMIHVNQRSMVARFEIDLRLLLDRIVNDGRDAIARRRYGADVTVIEQALDFVLAGEARLAAQLAA